MPLPGTQYRGARGEGVQHQLPVAEIDALGPAILILALTG
jgi:hypothetical protein